MRNLPDSARSRAILIGTSDYERSASLPALPAVGNNLLDLRRALTDPRTGILDLESCLVIDSPDSPTSMVGRLKRAARQAEDLLLVYYAGHGIRHDTKDLLYLAVRDTNTDNLATTAVPFELIRELMEESAARTRVLILDCCYSGMAIGFMSGDALSTREINVSGTSVITSVSRNDKSVAPPGERYTAFTGELISLLENGSPLCDEPLTLLVVYRSLLAALGDRGLPRPKFVSGDNCADLLMRRSEVAAPQALPPSPPTVKSDIGRPNLPDRVEETPSRPVPLPVLYVGRPVLSPASVKRGSPLRSLPWALLFLVADIALLSILGLKDDGGDLVASSAAALIYSPFMMVFGVVLWKSVRRRPLHPDALAQPGLLVTMVKCAIMVVVFGFCYYSVADFVVSAFTHP